MKFDLIETGFHREIKKGKIEKKNKKGTELPTSNPIPNFIKKIYKTMIKYNLTTAHTSHSILYLPVASVGISSTLPDCIDYPDDITVLPYQI